MQIVGMVWVCRIWSFYTGLIDVVSEDVKHVGERHRHDSGHQQESQMGDAVIDDGEEFREIVGNGPHLFGSEAGNA